MYTVQFTWAPRLRRDSQSKIIDYIDHIDYIGAPGTWPHGAGIDVNAMTTLTTY